MGVSSSAQLADGSIAISVDVEVFTPIEAASPAEAPPGDAPDDRFSDAQIEDAVMNTLAAAPRAGDSNPLATSTDDRFSDAQIEDAVMDVFDAAPPPGRVTDSVDFDKDGSPEIVFIDSDRRRDA